MSSDYLTQQSGANYDLYCRNLTPSGSTTIAGDLTVNGNITSLNNVFVTGSFFSNNGLVTKGAIQNDSTAAASTSMNVAVLNDGLYNYTGNFAGSVIVDLPTAAQIVAAYPQLQVGSTLTFMALLNQSNAATADLTISTISGPTNPGVTAATYTLSVGTCRMFQVRMTNVSTGTEAAQVYAII